MKSFVKILCGLSILGFATVACNKEVETQTPAASKHSVKVTAGISSDTRTEMLPSGNQTKWTAEDVANMHFFENGIAPAEGDLDVKLNADKTQLTIKAEFANTSATQFVYTSILASNLVEIDENKNAILDDEQFILNGTFDPLADILVAKPEERDASQNLVEFSMQYKRVVAVNKIKIKGLEAGDKIESVTISSNKPFLGSYSMTNDAWTNSGYELTLDAYDEIEVSSTGEVSLYFITAPVENAVLSLYVETDNHKYEKDFTKTITFAANTVTSFATTVAESEIDDTPTFTGYKFVESAPTDWKGTYVLVGRNNTDYYAYGVVDAGDYSWGAASSVAVSSNTITTENSSLELVIENGSTSGTYRIKSGSNYLSAGAARKFNVLDTYSADKCDVTISLSNGVLTIKQASSTNNRQIRYNYNNGSGGFRWYDGETASAPLLFVKDLGVKRDLAAPVFSAQVNNETLNGIIVTWTDVTKAENYTVTCTDESDQTIAAGVQRAEFTDLEPGTYTITVRANPSDPSTYNAATAAGQSVEIMDYQLVAPTMTFIAGEDNIVANWAAVAHASSYTYTVLGPSNDVVVAETNTENLTFTVTGLTDNTAYTFKIKSNGEAPYISSDFRTQTQKTKKAAITTIAGIKAEITAISSSSANQFSATLTNAVVTSKSGSSAFVQDASGAMYLYNCAGDLAVGNVINGTVSGKGYIYYGLKEITAFNVSEATITTGGSVTIPELTLAQLMANYSTYEYTKVKIIRAHVTDAVNTGSNDANGEVTDGTNTLALYASGSGRNLPKDAVVNIVGHPSFRNNAKQFASYGEAASDEILYYIPTISTTTSIIGVPADGVTDAEHSITITNDTGWSIDVSKSGCVTAAALNEAHSKIVYSVSKNTSETDPAQGTIVVTLSHDNETAVVKTINVSQLAAGGGYYDYTSTFTDKSWGSTGDFGWTSGKEGAGFSNNGIQVTTSATGANGTTNKTFTDVSQVVVTYNTNKSKGAGTLDLKIGSNTTHTAEWAYSGSADGTTANFTCTFTVSDESGAIKLTANTTTNSIYIVSVTVKAKGVSE